MISEAEKRSRFEQLLHAINLPESISSQFFQTDKLEKVEVDANKKTWQLFISRQELLPSSAYQAFLSQLNTHFAQIAHIELTIQYELHLSTQMIVEEYWGTFIEWAKIQVASINGWLKNATYTCVENQVNIELFDETVLALAEKKGLKEILHLFFKTYFLREVEVYLKTGIPNEEVYKEFQEEIQRTNQAAIEKMMAEMPAPKEKGSAPTGSEKIHWGYEIKEPPVSIAQIQDQESRVVIEGMTFGFEMRELRNGTTLYQFYITDYTDSIPVKIFSKSKEDVAELAGLQNGKWFKVRGKVEYDRFSQQPELILLVSDLHEINAPEERMDESETKRVEFHLHSTMSAMDGVASIDAYIKTAAKWGHRAIAISDHGGVQAYPDAAKSAKKHGIKMIYGLEANVVPDHIEVSYNAKPIKLEEAEYVVFDIETTGLSITQNQIIEIAGIKVKQGQEIDRFSTFVDPGVKIPYNIQQLTHITDEMVAGAPKIDEVLPKFQKFVGNAVLVAHNARFDMGFIQAFSKKLNMPSFDQPVIDTLELARLVHPNLKNHRLNTLADRYRVSLDNHHRAIDDTIALNGILLGLLKDAKEQDYHTLEDLNRNVGKQFSHARPFHCNIYAMNAEGKKNLYKLVSMSHTEYFKRVPRIPKSVLNHLREGLIIVSGCEKGEMFETALNKSVEEAEAVADFYDVLEIQPRTMYQHLVDKGLVASMHEIEQTLQRIVSIGKKIGKPVIATGNAHYLEPRDKISRDITIHGITGFSPLKDQKKPDAHFRTTQEMIEEFGFLGTDIAHEVVVKNTCELADRIEEIKLFPSELFTPVIEGADEEIRNTCYDTAKQLYGEELPEVVVKRLEKELEPIIRYGFSANYLISERLVKKSNQDGYLVGSRGSVGSSVVATFLGISEVNPLPPHYRCEHCKHSEWILDGSIPSGFNLPDKSCPTCKNTLKGDGQDIPFETFLGFKGDKIPDIDLNFSGEYQPHAHNYTKELFGAENVFRAGTIGTVAEKTAYGYVKKYEEEFHKQWRNAEVIRLASGCTGVKRSTGQHPGGIVVLPDYMEIEDITPVQFPADDVSSEWKTTHFDYHAFDENLLKLDILGHDDPTMMRMLQDLTGVDPTSIPMNDPKVMSLFSTTEELGVTPEKLKSPVATYGVPEMGTKFVRQMLKETQPANFADLLQISGLSHGTGVWVGNAQELIRNGTCTIKTVIGCRDDIMLYLIYKANMDAGLAFKITESVRKGKGLTQEWIDEMKRCKVPNWYIESCQRIEYMFPKAHAAAYVISAVRTAYFKLYHPISYYAAYFTVRAEDFDIELCCQGYDAIYRKIEEIEQKGFQATAKEKGMVSILEMALEMTARGFYFKTIDLYRSEAFNFVIDQENSLIPPFSSLPGVGENAAKGIASAREKGEILSVEDFQQKSKAGKNAIELLRQMGCFRDLPESNQLQLF